MFHKTGSISNVFSFRPISFNAFWKSLRLNFYNDERIIIKKIVMGFSWNLIFRPGIFFLLEALRILAPLDHPRHRNLRRTPLEDSQKTYFLTSRFP